MKHGEGWSRGDEVEVEGVSWNNKVHIHTTHHVAGSQLQGNNAIMRKFNEQRCQCLDHMTVTHRICSGSLLVALSSPLITVNENRDFSTACPA